MSNNPDPTYGYRLLSKGETISETDERKAYIRTKSGGWVMYFSALALIIAGIVAGYYSMTVFFTLLAAGMFEMLVIAGLKIYYSFRN